MNDVHEKIIERLRDLPKSLDTLGELEIIEEKLYKEAKRELLVNLIEFKNIVSRQKDLISRYATRDNWYGDVLPLKKAELKELEEIISTLRKETRSLI